MPRFLIPALAAALVAGGLALDATPAAAQTRTQNQARTQNQGGATAWGDPWLNENDFDYNQRHWIPGPGGRANDQRYGGGQSEPNHNNYGGQNYSSQNYNPQNRSGPTASGNAWLNENDFDYNRRHWLPGPGGNQNQGYGQNWNGGQGSYGQNWNGNEGAYGQNWNGGGGFGGQGNWNGGGVGNQPYTGGYSQPGYGYPR